MTSANRTLGDLSTSAIGYGAMVLSPGMYGPIDDESAALALAAAVDAGCTLIDTSDGYGAGGHNEQLVGRAVHDLGDRVQVATKFGFLLQPGAEPHTFPVRYEFGQLAVNADPRHVRAYAEASLRRLGRDVIDLYYPHFPDPQIPYADTIGAVADLINAGLVRHLGVSNVTAAQLREAHTVHPVAAVQTQWSMWAPIDPELYAAARELGVGVTAWSPLGGGFLTGQLPELAADDFRRAIPRFSAENLATNRDRYAPIRELAAGLGITPGQLALAWLLDQYPHVVPMPGSRVPAHIRENAAAAQLALDAETRSALSAVLAAIRPAGEVSVL